MEDYYMVEEMLWGAERGASCFTFVSLFFANFHRNLWVGCLFGVFLWFGVGLVCFFLGLVLWKFCTQLAPVLFEFPVVDRLCFALARQCRKKKFIVSLTLFFFRLTTMIVYRILDAAPAPGFALLSLLKPLLDLRCCQRLAGPRFWQCSAPCLLSLLRQAKIYWVDSEVAAASHVSYVSLFARYNLLEGLPCKYISSFALEFLNSTRIT